MIEATYSPVLKHSASASGIDDVQCPRKFVFRNLMPKETRLAPHTTALFGKRFHKVAEDYHVEAKPPDPKSDEGNAFLKGLHLNPLPMQWKVEGYFKRTIMGIEFRGYKDLETFGQGIDHKTSAAPAKAVELLKPETDPQGLIYAFDGMERYGTPTYDFTWIYYPSPSAPKSARPEIRKHRYEAKTIVDQFWQYCYQPALLIARIRAQWATDQNPLHYRPNYSFCSAYGGCRYQESCGVR